ncbi:MAG TPA: substrate-binding domain-containing protein [Steroidobacteraceae bacterium]|nr:substrate-binding domain-containing protein [Steroidobacteraceae bacterium]
MRNVHIAAAVAVALGAGGSAFAEAPTPTQAMQAAHNVYMAGSSAAVNGVLSYIEGTVCGSAYSVFTTPTSSVGEPDFRAVSCSPANNQPFSGSTLTVWFRPEGGSVVGVFPVINNTQIKQLNMTAAGCTTSAVSSAAVAAYTCTVVGTTPQNGTDDSFGTGTFAHNVDVGISDLEPGVFASLTKGTSKAWAGGGHNDPTAAYAASFTGPDQGASATQGLTHTTIFEQVFGFIVNTSLPISDLPKEEIAAIYDGNVTDWSQVSTGTSSGRVTSVSTPIIVCNREIGSGTRASTDIFLNGDGCNPDATFLKSVAGTEIGATTLTYPVDNFATNLEIACVNNNPNSIGYVSIDNFSKDGTTTAPNVKSITVSGATASQATGATGLYSYVFEASMNLNPQASGDGQAWYTDLKPKLQAGTTTATSGQILAIPQTPNTAQIPLQVGNEPTSLFLRAGFGAGNSCDPLADQL